MSILCLRWSCYSTSVGSDQPFSKWERDYAGEKREGYRNQALSSLWGSDKGGDIVGYRCRKVSNSLGRNMRQLFLDCSCPQNEIAPRVHSGCYPCRLVLLSWLPKQGHSHSQTRQAELPWPLEHSFGVILC